MAKMSSATTEKKLIAAARQLCDDVEKLRFKPPVTHVYNPLVYAWAAHEMYLRRFGSGQKKIVFVGMNPGPFGMVQTGIPFGEICAVRDWLKISAPISKPAKEHPKRPILGFDCARMEVSGQRLWNFFADRFGASEKFFAQHFVVNYCPLAFLQASGANHTPDKLPAAEAARLFRACDAHLIRVLEILQPEWIIGIGAFATNRIRVVSEKLPVQVGQILHPSPASPAANRGWAGKVNEQLKTLGVWK